VFYAGELDKWLAKSGVSPLAGEERAGFWREVLSQMGGAEPLFGGAVSSLERSSALLRPSGWRQRRRLRGPYREASERLFRTVAAVAGTATVVDTSHYPLRAAELQSLEGIELYLLLLVRDPLSVVASFNREDVPERRFGVLTTNAYLWLTYLLAIPIFLRQPRERRLLVRHEALLGDPEATLGQILQQIGSDSEVPDLTALRTGFAFQGNRLVRTDVVALKAGTPRPPRASRVTAILQLPLALVLARMRPAVNVAGDRAAAAG